LGEDYEDTAVDSNGKCHVIVGFHGGYNSNQRLNYGIFLNEQKIKFINLVIEEEKARVRYGKYTFK
jgi:hypothetical protein